MTNTSATGRAKGEFPSVKALLLAASSGIAFAAAGLVNVAAAQEAGSQTGEDGLTRGDTVVVTARHREEDVQDVSAAVTVLGGEFIAQSGTDSIDDVARLVPSVQFANYNPRNSQINIRGLGSAANLANDGLEPGVGFYVDQVYYARPATSTFDLIDLDSVQILRGVSDALCI